MNPACSEWQARRPAGLAAVFPSDEMTSITPLAVCVCTQMDAGKCYLRDNLPKLLSRRCRNQARETCAKAKTLRIFCMRGEVITDWKWVTPSQGIPQKGIKSHQIVNHHPVHGMGGREEGERAREEGKQM